MYGKLFSIVSLFFIFISYQHSYADDTLRVNIYFDTGDHILKEKEDPKLDSLVKYLLSIEEYKLDLRGHTDSRGSVAYNQKLSERRMETVKKALARRHIKKKDMTKSAWSELMPAANNDNAHGMMLNRRVEIVVIIPPDPEEIVSEDDTQLIDTLKNSESKEAKILRQYGYTRDRTFDETTFTDDIIRLSLLTQINKSL